MSAVTAGNATTRAEALSALTAAHDTLTGRSRQFQEQVASCGSNTDALSCVESADRELANAFDAFAGEVDSVNFPTAKADAAEVERLAREFAGALRQLATANSEADYTRLASEVDPLGRSFDQKYQALVHALTG